MVRTGNSLEAFAESDRWFSLLVEPGDASAWDWQGQGGRQFARKDYKSAGDSYVQAAQSPYLWNDWRPASIAYSLIDSGAEDDALKAARACIQNGAGKKDSDTLLASAHNTAAGVLNKRGVYEEALSHAREAVAIDLPARARYSGKALGPNHAAAASILNNLLWTKGDRVSAVKLYRRAVSIDESVYGPEDPEVAADLANLRMLLKERCENTAADGSLRRALAIDLRNSFRSQ
jgi:tetratricopeptide (TPR) repeat protein